MKNVVRTLSLMLPLAVTCLGGPLQREQVAANAKWLVHLDVDKLRSTTVGDYVINRVLDEKLGPMTRQFEFDLDWKKVRSLTAYGTDYQPKSDFDGVLLIKTDLDLQKALDAAVEKTAAAKGNRPAPLEKTQEGDVTTYSLKDQLFASFKAGRPVIVGKSLESIQKAGEVLSGTAPNLAATKMLFPEFPKSKPYFFFGAVKLMDLGTQASEEAQDRNAANPRAKILKLAEAGRLMLGEDSKELFLDVSLKAKSAEVVTQIQQVIQGMIALASLSQLDNQDLQQLAQSAKVSSLGNIVTLKLGYPADQAVTLLSSNLNRHLEQKEHARHSDRHRMKHKSNETPQEPEKTEPEKTDEK